MQKVEFPFKGTATGGDETVIRITTTVYANQDFSHPSTGTSDRTETYVYKIQYKDDGSVNSNYTGQDWISASHYAPYSIFRIKTVNWTSHNPYVTKQKVDNIYTAD